MKLNKLLSLSAVLACGLTLAACDNGQTTDGTSQGSTTVTPNTVSVNVGLGYTASFDAKKGQVDLTTAMVAFDEAGKVVSSRIDVIQVVVGNVEGEVEITNAAAKLREDGMPKTKLELGKDYNMKGTSANIGVIAGGLEVDAQIESFAAWTKGKTAEEISASYVMVTQNEDGTFSDGRKHSHGGNFTTDEALWSTCTITVDGFAKAVANAYANKSTKAVEVEEGFKVGVAVNANMYNATTLDLDIAGALVKEGKVAAALTDCVAVEFNNVEGAVSLKTDSQYYDAATSTFKSKKALGDNYNMATYGASMDKNGDGVVLEWYVQAALVEAATLGKTAEEIKVLVKDEGNGNANAIAQATMNIDMYVTAIARAATYAELALIGPQA